MAILCYHILDILPKQTPQTTSTDQWPEPTVKIPVETWVGAIFQYQITFFCVNTEVMFTYDLSMPPE